MTEPKTIKIIGPAYPYRGGLANYNERLAREFLAHGHHRITSYNVCYTKLLRASSYKKNNPNTKKRLAAVIFIIATLSTVIATGCKTCECPAYSQKNEKTKIKIINNELFQTETSKNIILHCEHMQNEHDQNSLLNS